MLQIHGFDPSTPPARRRQVVVVLVLAVLGISSSAVLVRGMPDIGPIALAAWRTLGAALLLTPGIAAGRGTVGVREGIGIVLAGAALALHFPLWFASLSYTTILRSTVLVALVPIWSGLLEWAMKGDSPRPRFWFGLALALPGVALMSGIDGLSGGNWYGDSLSIVAGMAYSVYLAIGRRIRQTVPVTTYMGLVCAVTAVLLFPAAAAFEAQLWGFSPLTWVLLAAAVLGPQLLGHQGATYAVRFLPASVVAAVMLLEPVGATALGAIVYQEIPSLGGVLGGSLVVGGVVLATFSPSS